MTNERFLLVGDKKGLSPVDIETNKLCEMTSEIEGGVNSLTPITCDNATYIAAGCGDFTLKFFRDH